MNLLQVEVVARERHGDVQRERARLQLIGEMEGRRRPRSNRTRRMIAFMGAQLVRWGTQLEAYGGVQPNECADAPGKLDATAR